MKKPEEREEGMRSGDNARSTDGKGGKNGLNLNFGEICHSLARRYSIKKSRKG